MVCIVITKWASKCYLLHCLYDSIIHVCNLCPFDSNTQQNLRTQIKKIFDKHRYQSNQLTLSSNIENKKQQVRLPLSPPQSFLSPHTHGPHRAYLFSIDPYPIFRSDYISFHLLSLSPLPLIRPPY